jgi:polar amino acid transport system substrate-binding protein
MAGGGATPAVVAVSDGGRVVAAGTDERGLADVAAREEEEQRAVWRPAPRGNRLRILVVGCYHDYCGYGDKAPRTFAGRVVGLVWMFAAIIIISSFTAAITSALTLSQLGSFIRGPGDLPGARVAAVASSTGEQHLKARHINYRGYPDALSALQALAVGMADAVVYDAPILNYLAKEKYPGAIYVLPNTFVRQDYAIAVPQGSPLRETLDRVLEHEIRSPRWQEVIYHYLGGDE